MRNRFMAVAVLCLVGLTLAGCALGPEGIFRTFSTGNDANKSVITDAKQRAILSRQPEPSSRPGLVSPHSVVCAEPSPDVATALAGSVGSSLSVFGYGSGALSAQQVEGMAQLAERTASIQLMRDQMYRACEAYANGAITGTNYSLLMSKITDTMVTLLMGETAGGAFGRSLAALGTKASAEARASMSGMPGFLQDVQQSTQQLADAELEVQTAQSKYEKSLAARKDALAAAKDTTTDPEADAGVKADHAALNSAKTKRDALKESLQGHLDAASEAAGEVSSMAAGGSISAKPDAAVAGVLGDMQRTFINRDPSYALVESCLVELGMWSAGGPLDAYAQQRLENLMQRDASGNLRVNLNMAINQAQGPLMQTGLYRFCQENLKTIAPEIFRVNAAIALERLDTDRRSIDLQWISARANAASSFAAALAECDKIIDASSKETCKASVLDMRNQGAPGPSDAGRALQSAVGFNGGNDARPTLTFDQAVGAFDRATQAAANLDGLAFTPIPASIVGDDRQDATNRQKKLEEKKKKEVSAAREILAQLPKLDKAARDASRQQLVTFEQLQLSQVNIVANAADPYDRAIARANLEKTRATARIEESKYDEVQHSLEALITKLGLVAGEIADFNKNPTGQ